MSRPIVLKWPPKDPDEKLDYELDWSLRLAGDEVATSVWTVPVGTATIPDGEYSYTTAVTKVWLQGGADGEDCDVHNRITTVGGRTMDQTVLLPIRAK